MRRMFRIDDWDPDRMMDRSYGNGTGMMNGGGWLIMLIGLLLLVLVGVAIFLAIRATGAGSTGRGTGPATGSARDVLDLRLARGEISAEEYGTTRTLLDP